MPSKTVVVGSAVGLHARPAAIIAEKAGELGSRSPSPINGVDASSSLMIMTLGAKNGDTVEVESDDQAALDTIAGARRAGPRRRTDPRVTDRRREPRRSRRRSSRPAARGSRRARRPPAPAPGAPRLKNCSR